MERGTISVRTKTGREDVRAYMFEIEGLGFGVHRNVGPGNYWSVTERTTGLQFTWASTRKAAVERAEGTVDRYGVEVLKEQIRSGAAEAEAV